jgi:hypothetical protein
VSVASGVCLYEAAASVSPKKSKRRTHRRPTSRAAGSPSPSLPLFSNYQPDTLP